MSSTGSDGPRSLAGQLKPDPRRLFRLPWTASDNAMTWLEPTQKCNITCDACFVENRATSEKSLDQIRYELEFMMRCRRCDAMLIAGGEPLTHPRIVDIVRLTKETGAKPVLVTNGVALDRSLVRELKKAGAHGFTLHVDSHQRRPGWIGKSERELNELRRHYADLLYEEGGLTCAFNTTIFPDTLAAVPEIVEWAIGLPERVHVLTLICVRMLEPGAPYDYYVGDRQVDVGLTPYVSAEKYENLMAEDIYREIKKVLPDFEFCSYLGGTQNPQALKWAVGCRIGTGARSYGHMGPRSMEILQNVHHAVHNRYLAFSRPRTTRSGRAALLLGVVDPDMRRAAGRFLGSVLRNPLNLFRRAYVQGISVVQPVDVLPTGECDTCDGCPNKTFWQERLVSACRAEEYRKFGGPVRLVPRREEVS
jgi:hypothetical protein